MGTGLSNMQANFRKARQTSSDNDKKSNLHNEEIQ